MTSLDLTPAVPVPRADFARGGYVLDGPPEKFLISSTRALQLAGLSFYPEPSDPDRAGSAEFSRQLGSAVHAATAELDLHGDTAETDPQVLGYVAAWRAFKRVHRWKSLLVEEPCGYARCGYGCRPDRVGEQFDGEFTVVEIKTGSPTRHYRLQTASQVMAVRDTWPQLGVPSRAVVLLEGNGSFKYREHPKGELSADFGRFLAAVTIARWHLDGKDPGVEDEA